MNLNQWLNRQSQPQSLFARYVGKYCLVRTESAGVFAGLIKAVEDDKCVIVNSRRMWSWAGAFTLSELSMTGTKLPEKCKFPIPVEEELVFGIIEVLPCTPQARESLESVPITSASA